MEELKKKFIVEERLEERILSKYVERILPFCKISRDGGIIIENSRIITLEKIKLSLAARFLANYLENNIPAEISIAEISSSLSIPKDQVAARLKELKDTKFALSVSKGVYRVNPLQIGRFLNEMEGKYSAQRNEPE